MYNKPWVKAMVKQLQDFVVSNADWLGFTDGTEQRVLDYACGHGTMSLVSQLTARSGRLALY